MQGRTIPGGGAKDSLWNIGTVPDHPRHWNFISYRVSGLFVPFELCQQWSSDWEEYYLSLVIHCAISSPRKGHSCQGSGRDIITRGAPKGQTLEGWCRAHTIMQQRHKEPRPKRVITSGTQENSQQDLQANSWDFHYTAENECQDIVEGSAPSEMKLDWTQSKSQRCRSTDHSWISCLDRMVPLWWNHSGWAALRREQLESNHLENQAIGEKGDIDHRHHKHSSWKKTGSMPVGYSGQIALRSEQCSM
jgi:hypothetical protein